MGASVNAYWIGISDEQVEGQPGFYNDCNAWGDWMAERQNHPDVLSKIEELGLSSLLTFTTDGIDDSEVDWVTPQSLKDAANKLRVLALKQDPSVARIVETYATSANGVDPIHEELAKDLEDIVSIAEYAESQNVSSLTLQVNW